MALDRRITMFLWFIFLGSVLSMPTDEFKEFSRNDIGDFLKPNDKSNIVPGFVSADQQSRYISTYEKEWLDVMRLSPSNKYFKLLDNYIEKGSTSKGLTFCIYDDNMREAAITLFRLFETTEGEVFTKVKEWAKNNINKEMYMYALRLESVYSSKTKDSTFIPPFIWNPHYFVNSEVLAKASLIAEDLVTNGEIDAQIAKVEQYRYASTIKKEFVIINSNYSAWNLPKYISNDELNYFREDVSLNSYYFGVHLLHPFWMSNEELEIYNPRFAEHYYYANQQLVARYHLEKLHLNDKGKSSTDNWNYLPYLRYKNGLPFPTRSCTRGNWDSEKDYVQKIDIAIRECISRGLIIMQNGTKLTMTDDSHIEILAKLIRANIDGVKFAKIVRNVVGYGGHSFPHDEYNPAPSLLHQPETSLRDPAYWRLLEHMLNYFTDYKSTMEPFDLSKYESKEFQIVENNFSSLVTYFDDYRFSVNYALSNNIKDETDWTSCIAVRQRRLTHLPFSLNFTLTSTVEKPTIIRLYLGPECGNNCWDNHNYNKFYELDTFQYVLEEGVNFVSWNPEHSIRLSSDEDHNSVIPKNNSTRYSIFKFPETLLLPRGLEDGLNMTLFVMITPADEDDIPYGPSFYRELSTELDSMPLGFPFHRQAKGFNVNAYNYKFYNISIYHKPQAGNSKGNFSPHLY